MADAGSHNSHFNWVTRTISMREWISRFLYIYNAIVNCHVCVIIFVSIGMLFIPCHRGVSGTLYNGPKVIGGALLLLPQKLNLGFGIFSVLTSLLYICWIDNQHLICIYEVVARTNNEPFFLVSLLLLCLISMDRGHHLLLYCVVRNECYI